MESGVDMSARTWIFQWAPANQVAVYGPTTKDLRPKYNSVKHTMPKGIGSNDSYVAREAYAVGTIQWKLTDETNKTLLESIPKFMNVVFQDQESGIDYTLQIIEFIAKHLKTSQDGEILWGIAMKVRIISQS
jgi:hypothetical protein